MKKKIKNVFLITAVLILCSCSTKPKDTGDVVTIRIQTEKELAIAKSQASRGNYIVARGLLSECKNKAIMVDDWSLMIRTSLSLGNVLYSLDQSDEAFEQWDYAIALAQRLGNPELLSISKIYKARGTLLSDKTRAQPVLDEVTKEAANIKQDQQHIAFSWQVRGLALRENGKWREAEDAVKKSLDIHQKIGYLENASYDWYLIGSIRSLAGNTQAALQALDSSIAIDRRIENSWGLAVNYRAIGDVQKRAGNNAKAEEAYRHSKAIFIALKNDKEAAEIDRRMASN